jgi:hypothetical protein
VKQSLKNDLEKLDADTSIMLYEYRVFMKNKQYTRAGKLCERFIRKWIKVWRRRVINNNEKFYNKLLVFMIFFEALKEYTEIVKITKNRKWHQNNDIVEVLWMKMLDCKDRLEFVLAHYTCQILERVLTDIYGLNEFFRKVFGDGSYISPGIICEKYLCTICRKDTRACSHIAGRLYNGQICYYQPTNEIFNHIAIVKIPKDPRCRIWPWRLKDNPDGEGVVGDCTILTTFSVDDFLQNG